MGRRFTYPPTPRRREQARAALLIAVPVVAAYSLLFRHIHNVPWQDDYWAIIQFSLVFLGHHGLKARAAYLIAAQYVDYKLVVEHLVVVAELGLLHQLNFAFFEILGDLLLLVVLWFAWRLFQPGGIPPARRLLLFAPAVFVLFSLNYVETLDWAMAGLQNLPVVVFSLWALYLLFGTRSAQGDFGAGRFGLACAVGLLAALSSANGFLVAPIGFVAFAMRRHYARVALWTATFLLGIAVYLYKYRPAYPTMHVAAYVKPLFVLAVLGLAAPGLLAIPTGIALIGVWLGLVRSGFHRVNRFGFAVSLWIFLTAILIAIGRGSYGLGGAQASRYRIYCDLLPVYCYGFLVERVVRSQLTVSRQKLLYAAALVTSMLYCAKSELAAFHLLRLRDADLATGLAEYRADPERRSPIYLSDEKWERAQAAQDEAARQIMNESVRTGLYLPPATISRH